MENGLFFRAGGSLRDVGGYFRAQGLGIEKGFVDGCVMNARGGVGSGKGIEGWELM